LAVNRAGAAGAFGFLIFNHAFDGHRPNYGLFVRENLFIAGLQTPYARARQCKNSGIPRTMHHPNISGLN